MYTKHVFVLYVLCLEGLKNINGRTDLENIKYFMISIWNKLERAYEVFLYLIECIHILLSKSPKTLK